MSAVDQSLILGLTSSMHCKNCGDEHFENNKINNKRKTQEQVMAAKSKVRKPMCRYEAAPYGSRPQPYFVDWTKRAPKVDMRGKQRVTLQDFELLKVLGTGAFGKVFLTRKTSGPDAGTLYALKQTKKREFLDASRRKLYAETERRVLEHVRDSPFIVKLHYAFQTDSSLNLVLEYANGGDFYTYLQTAGKFKENVAKFYIAELVLALETLHTMGIIYRDLKPENILLDAEGHIVLTDFGLSEEFDPGTLMLMAKKYIGTEEYIAPEISINSDNYYDFTVDWWSLGVVAYDFMVGCSPFSLQYTTSNARREMKDVVLSTEPSYPRHLSKHAKDFIRCLLTKDPRHRLGANGVQEVKNHLFLRIMNWDLLAHKTYHTVPKVPKIRHAADVSNFETEFTRMPLSSAESVAPNDCQALTCVQRYSYVDPSIPLMDTTTTTTTTSTPSPSDGDQRPDIKTQCPGLQRIQRGDQSQCSCI